jgi:molybdopterin-guanine dinucleotide biosynthesis protein
MAGRVTNWTARPDFRFREGARSILVRATKPAIVAVGGFTSNSGKTTLVCELLRALRGWEAIKMSRGHYRSCGKDPQACCISPLLGAEPVLRSGHAETYAHGKDTGRYWEAGAANVHWAIVTDRQVEGGVRAALERVKSHGVLIEGNSFLRFVEADFSVIVARTDVLKIKPSARRALPKASAIYLSDGEEGIDPSAHERFHEWQRQAGLCEAFATLPIYTRKSLPQLIARIVSIQAAQDVSRRAVGTTAMPGF